MASILEQIASAVQVLAPGPVYAFGTRALAPAIVLPRVVWVPSRDGFGATENIGGLPRQLATCTAGIDAHIFGVSVEQVEAVRNALTAAAFQFASTSLQLDAATGEWTTQRAIEQGWITGGEAYVLSLAFATPVLAPDETTVTIAAVASDDTTGTVPGDGVLTCGET